MISNPAGGTGRMRGASSSDSTSRNVAEVAPSNALRQRCHPQSERTRCRTASSVSVSREGAKAATHWFAERRLANVLFRTSRDGSKPE